MSSACARSLACVLTPVVAALALTSRDAAACVACGSGDPTTAAFADDDGGFRVLLTLRSRDERLGQTGVDRIDLRELRSELGLAWRDDVLGVELALPMLWRDVRYANDGLDLVLASGDLSVRARVALASGIGDLAIGQPGSAGPSGLAITAGVSLPTAPVLRRNGARLPLEAQPGTGSVDPSLGLAWSDAFGRWTPHVSLWATVPLGPANTSLRLSASLTVLVYEGEDVALSVRPALEGRRDGRAVEAGERVADSGGFILFGGGDVELALDTWVFTLGARAPLVDALDGYHREALFAVLAISYDVPR